MTKWKKTGHRYVVLYFDLKDLYATHIKAKPDSTRPYERRSGRPNKPEMVKKVHKIVLEDC